MESIAEIKSGVSELIQVREFLQSWNLEALEAVKMKSTPAEDDRKVRRIGKMMNVDDETVNELAEVCSVENLFCGDEPRTRRELLQMTSAPNINLECVRHQMEHKEARERVINQRTQCYRRMKYNNMDEYKFVRPMEEFEIDSVPYEARVPVPNVILSVRITKCRMAKGESIKAIPTETFSVLGTQKLTVLKDAINCPIDNVIAGDFSTMPDIDPDTLLRAKHLYKSGFFFIENIFYNDTREPDNKDYSAPIIDWTGGNWGNVQMSTADMDATTFLDLRLRLGCFYLFMHQGDCEHSVQFQDIRLFNSCDSQDLRLFPLQTSERIKMRKRCQGCGKISAKWVVYNSPLIPTNPSFFCPICFKTLMYTKDGEKTSDFKAYHYSENCL